MNFDDGLVGELPDDLFNVFPGFWQAISCDAHGDIHGHCFYAIASV
ncbi:MAG: hypothetical protein VX603_05155 [Gemmatimonadota bacterium]|nr:hypothetical protein [Gemmatimonadota bacterium]